MKMEGLTLPPPQALLSPTIPTGQQLGSIPGTSTPCLLTGDPLTLFACSKLATRHIFPQRSSESLLTTYAGFLALFIVVRQALVSSPVMDKETEMHQFAQNHPDHKLPKQGRAWGGSVSGPMFFQIGTCPPCVLGPLQTAWLDERNIHLASRGPTGFRSTAYLLFKLSKLVKQQTSVSALI